MREATLNLCRVIGLLVTLAAWITFLRAQCKERGGLHLVEDEHGNEALVLDSEISWSKHSLFLVDTAYAGAPVLSTSYLASPYHPIPYSSVQDRYRRALSHGDVSEDARRRAVRGLLTTMRSYTSGCTQRLLGIGEVMESQADMLLAGGLKFYGIPPTTGVDADVFVTNTLPGSVHILTSDYLIQNGPTLLMPAAGAVEFQMGLARQLALRPFFHFVSAHTYGGAFVVPVKVGGETLSLVLDTGAAVAVSLSSGVIQRLKTCNRNGSPRRITQTGVNGEMVCSDVFRADVKVAGIHFPDVEVCANSHDVEGADGYAGLALWRCFDLWISTKEVGFRRNSLKPRSSSLSSPGECSFMDPPSCLEE